MTAPRILIVCTGNICRSPLAEQLLRENLRNAGIDAVVTSAGTHAMTGSAMTPEAAALSTQYGASNTDHVARQLTEQLIADADLVLTATRDHRRDVVILLPKATRYTFTLNQFARLVAPAEAEDFAADDQTGLDSIFRPRGEPARPAAPASSDAPAGRAAPAGRDAPASRDAPAGRDAPASRDAHPLPLVEPARSAALASRDAPAISEAHPLPLVEPARSEALAGRDAPASRDAHPLPLVEPARSEALASRDAPAIRDAHPLPLVELAETAIPAPQPASATRPPLDFPAFIASVASTRGLHPSPNPPTLDDVEDPYRQPAAVYARAAAAINASVTTITAALIAAGA